MQTPPGNAPRQTMVQRYGAPRWSGRWQRSLLGLALAGLLVAWVIWAALGQQTPRAVAVLHSYDVSSPHTISVTLDVSRTDHGPVSCTVTAQAEDHSVVGQQVVHVPAGSASTVTARAVVRTNRTAVTAIVGRCR